MANSGSDSEWKKEHSLGVIALVLFIPIMNLVSGTSRTLDWALSVLAACAIFVVIGFGVEGRWFGALINDQGLYSISRLQVVAWSKIVIPAFAVCIFGNYTLGKELAVEIPNEILALMGISFASFVGSPIVKESKNTDTLAFAKSTSNRSKASVVQENQKKDLSVSNFFTGDGKENKDRIDLGKVQMFFFSVILAAFYGFKVYTTIRGTCSTSPIDSLPGLPPDSITLLGFSHAGYLGYKAASIK